MKNEDCKDPAKPRCDTAFGSCVAGCVSDSNCTVCEVCSDGACKPAPAGITRCAAADGTLGQCNAKKECLVREGYKVTRLQESRIPGASEGTGLVEYGGWHFSPSDTTSCLAQFSMVGRH